MPPFSEDPYLMLAQGVPSSVVYLAVVNRLTRRFRWSFLEPLARAADRLAADAPEDDYLWRNFGEVLEQCNSALESIERQGNVRELRAPGAAAAALDLHDRDLVDALWTTHDDRKARLVAAATARQPDEMRKVLGKWQSENKAFMLQLNDRMRVEIERLDPIERAGPMK